MHFKNVYNIINNAFACETELFKNCILQIIISDIVSYIVWVYNFNYYVGCSCKALIILADSVEKKKQVDW